MAISEHPDYLAQLMHELSTVEFFTLAHKKLQEIDVKTEEESDLLFKVVQESSRMYHDFKISKLRPEVRDAFFAYLTKIKVKPGVLFRSKCKYSPANLTSSPNPYEDKSKEMATPGRSTEPDYSSEKSHTPGRHMLPDYEGLDSTYSSGRTLEQVRTPGRPLQEPDYVPGNTSEKSGLTVSIRSGSPRNYMERSHGSGALRERGRSRERYHPSGRPMEGSRTPGRSTGRSQSRGRSARSRSRGRSVERPSRWSDDDDTPAESSSHNIGRSSSHWEEDRDSMGRSIEKAGHALGRSITLDRAEEIHHSGWSDVTYTSSLKTGSAATPDRNGIFPSESHDYGYKPSYPAWNKNRINMKDEDKNTAKRFGFSFAKGPPKRRG